VSSKYVIVIFLALAFIVVGIIIDNLVSAASKLSPKSHTLLTNLTALTVMTRVIWVLNQQLCHSVLLGHDLDSANVKIVKAANVEFLVNI
jgi:hypothetical protein